MLFLFFSLLAECSPGYYLVSGSCLPCGKGGYCSGGDASRLSCGTYLTTKSATAAAATACTTLPGVAFMTGPATAAPCPLNTYNNGGNQRNCTGETEEGLHECPAHRSVPMCSDSPARGRNTCSVLFLQGALRSYSSAMIACCFGYPARGMLAVGVRPARDVLS
jgi:hypothetical protein